MQQQQQQLAAVQQQRQVAGGMPAGRAKSPKSEKSKSQKSSSRDKTSSRSGKKREGKGVAKSWDSGGGQEAQGGAGGNAAMDPRMINAMLETYGYPQQQSFSMYHTPGSMRSDANGLWQSHVDGSGQPAPSHDAMYASARSPHDQVRKGGNVSSWPLRSTVRLPN